MIDKKMNGDFDETFIAMKKTPSFAEYTHWQELKDRVLVLNDAVDEFIVEEIVMPILKWNKEDDKAEEAAPYLPDGQGKNFNRKPITLYLNSPGGDLFNGLVAAEVIKKSKTPVHVIVLSMAASMGSVLLAAGHRRYAYQFSNVLIHDGSTGIAGTSNKVKDHMKFFDKKSEQIKTFIIANSKITAEKYEEMDDREWWLTAEEAMEFGLIDEIIQ
jgi:ATP-dependent Clp protease protease subunit